MPLRNYSFDGGHRFTITLANGQVWRQVDEDSRIATWKAGLSWEIDDQLRLRGTISRDIRAPNLNELFLASASLNFAIVDPVTHRRCEPHEVGEIWVRGSNVAAGYLGKPVESQETFAAHVADTGAGPFLRSRDDVVMVECSDLCSGVDIDSR